MKDINILHIIESLGPGGAERLMTSTLRYLDRDRFRSVIAYLYDEDHFSDDLLGMSFNVYKLHAKNIYQAPKIIKSLLKIIRDEKIDMIHTHLFGASIYGRLSGWLSRVSSIVTTLHNPDYSPYFTFRNKFSFERRRFLDRLSGNLFNDSFIAVSEAVKESAERFLGFKDIKVMYNSIDPDEFEPLSDKERSEERKRLGIPDGCIALVIVGRLDPQKGHTFLFRALNDDRLKGRDIKLFVAGKGQLENELRREVEALGLQDKIVFLGSTKDVRGTIGCCDIFILPSVYEGFGIALLEAMALKIPCIASYVDGVKEIVVDKKEGLLVEPCSPQSITEAIVHLIENPDKRSNMVEAGYSKVIKDFNIKKQVRLLEDVYSHVLR